MRTLVVGDIHGGYKALMQALERANYDASTDRIIFLGDVADGWPEVNKCLEFIAGTPNKVYILGNHDEWFLDWIVGGGYPEDIWWTQGGAATVQSYFPEAKTPWLAAHRRGVPIHHEDVLKNAVLYHEETGPKGERRLFVHGGVIPELPLEDHEPHHFVWNTDPWGNRILWNVAQRFHGTGENVVPEYDEIYIGHTQTYPTYEVPVLRAGVWNLDQGGGWSGKLSIMDVDTKEFWQSDLVKTLYPDAAGRR